MEILSLNPIRNNREYLIDGYNLMHQMHSLKVRMCDDLEGARNGLIMRLSGFARKKKALITLVFDGQSHGESHAQKNANLRVWYSRPPEKADDLLKKTMEKERRKGLVAVSSDLELIRYARVMGIEVLKSSEFIREMESFSTPHEEPLPVKRMTPKDLEDWLKLFQRGNPDMGDTKTF